MLNGVDISKWQGTIDWGKFPLDFAIIKATEGVGYVDAQFARNNSEVVSRNIPHGFYHYVFGSGNTPEGEAGFFLDTLGQLSPGEVLAIDFEEPNKVANPVDYVRRMAQTIIDRTGVRPFIYLNSSLCRSYNWQPLVDMNCGLWIANYGPNNGQPNGEPAFAYWPFYAMWQYTSVGKVDGMSGNIDLNQFFGNLQQFFAYGYGGTPPEPPFIWDGIRYELSPVWVFSMREPITLWDFSVDYPIVTKAGDLRVKGKTNIIKGSSYYIPEGNEWDNHLPVGWKEEDLFDHGDLLPPEPPPTTTTTTTEPLPEPTTTTTTTEVPQPEPTTTTTTTTATPPDISGEIAAFFIGLYHWIKQWFTRV